MLLWENLGGPGPRAGGREAGLNRDPEMGWGEGLEKGLGSELRGSAEYYMQKNLSTLTNCVATETY